MMLIHLTFLKHVGKRGMGMKKGLVRPACLFRGDMACVSFLLAFRWTSWRELHSISHEMSSEGIAPNGIGSTGRHRWHVGKKDGPGK